MASLHTRSTSPSAAGAPASADIGAKIGVFRHYAQSKGCALLQTWQSSDEDVHRIVGGHRIRVTASLRAPTDLSSALVNGAEAWDVPVGGYLSFIRSKMTVDDGATTFCRTTAADGRAVTLRVADLDELQRHLGPVLEANPYSRYSVMLTQGVADLRRVRAVIERQTAVLGMSGAIPVGILVDHPGAAMQIDRLAAEADFLCLSADDLSSPASASGPRYSFDPGLFRLIDVAARRGRAHGRRIAVCGRLAAFCEATAALIGLGVSELVVHPAATWRVGSLIRRLSYVDCLWAAQQALEQD